MSAAAMPTIAVERDELLAVLAQLDQAARLHEGGEYSAHEVARQAREQLAQLVDAAPLVWEIRNG